MTVSLPEERELPPGWVRQFSPDHSRWYYVDTSGHAKGRASSHDDTANQTSTRSTWNHPYFDEAYLSGLDPDKRTIVEWDNWLFKLRQMGVGVSYAMTPERVKDAQEALAVIESTRTLASTSSRSGSSYISPVESLPETSTGPGAAGSSTRFKRMSQRFKSPISNARTRRSDKRKAKKKEVVLLSQARVTLRHAFNASQLTKTAQLVQEDVDGRSLVVLPPRPDPNPFTPEPPDRFGHLLYNPRIRCIRPPSDFDRPTRNAGSGAGPSNHSSAMPALATIVGGLIIGALLV